jgi:hypothetical protein
LLDADLGEELWGWASKAGIVTLPTKPMAFQPASVVIGAAGGDAADLEEKVKDDCRSRP